MTDLEDLHYEIALADDPIDSALSLAKLFPKHADELLDFAAAFLAEEAFEEPTEARAAAR